MAMSHHEVISLYKSFFYKLHKMDHHKAYFRENRSFCMIFFNLYYLTTNQEASEYKINFSFEVACKITKKNKQLHCSQEKRYLWAFN